ncbi:hypothetical protein [Methylobacterium oryzihabitans]|uniref:hypothetical protein n=1 Tax=Methylobacterium oryzihabitans TaxID=2499852 RepID=UPI001AEEC664|nr:hypothetical protein [Methylobacterium oryzihabitans]
MDSDRLGAVPARDARAVALAKQHGFRLILQEPCHEAFLLRHLQGCERVRPPDAEHALTELTRRWPDYHKGLPADGLAGRIDAASVLRIARLHTELAAFLADIEFAMD